MPASRSWTALQRARRVGRLAVGGRFHPRQILHPAIVAWASAVTLSYSLVFPLVAAGHPLLPLFNLLAGLPVDALDFWLRDRGPGERDPAGDNDGGPGVD